MNFNQEYVNTTPSITAPLLYLQLLLYIFNAVHVILS